MLFRSQGYRGGTENVPGIVAMAAAIEQDRGWIGEASRLRTMLDNAIGNSGGIVVAGEAERIPTIASYRMPGVSARTQLIRFDMAGIAVSAGAACSSGTLKTSPVLTAMGVIVQPVDRADDVAATVAAAGKLAVNTSRVVAVQIAQRVVGAKEFK